MTASPLAGTALLCLVVFASTVCVGAFGPLLPEIARAQGLPDWQLGLLAGSFGFARMAADLPVGAIATRRLATVLTLAPVTLLAGMLLLATAGPLPVLVLGRLFTGLRRACRARDQSCDDAWRTKTSVQGSRSPVRHKGYGEE